MKFRETSMINRVIGERHACVVQTDEYKSIVQSILDEIVVSASTRTVQAIKEAGGLSNIIRQAIERVQIPLPPSHYTRKWMSSFWEQDFIDVLRCSVSDIRIKAQLIFSQKNRQK